MYFKLLLASLKWYKFHSRAVILLCCYVYWQSIILSLAVLSQNLILQHHFLLPRIRKFYCRTNSSMWHPFSEYSIISAPFYPFCVQNFMDVYKTILTRHDGNKTMSNICFWCDTQLFMPETIFFRAAETTYYSQIMSLVNA